VNRGGYTRDVTLPNTYADRNCSLARTMEVVGERWTLLIIRDAFYGVRRFGDFAAQLKIPRAVLANRLKALVQEGVLTRDDDAAGNVEYRLTAKGVALWPVVHAMMTWGDAYYSPTGVKRTLRHDQDAGLLDHDGRCQACGRLVPVPDIRIEPGPGYEPPHTAGDPLSDAINTPRRLLDPITAPRATGAA
jgi:DNA-binding HxlR family transcriptional regulator